MKINYFYCTLFAICLWFEGANRQLLYKWSCSAMVNDFYLSDEFYSLFDVFLLWFSFRTFFSCEFFSSVNFFFSWMNFTFRFFVFYPLVLFIVPDLWCLLSSRRSRENTFRKHEKSKCLSRLINDYCYSFISVSRKYSTNPRCY